jgi:hypothetical protein
VLGLLYRSVPDKSATRGSAFGARLGRQSFALSLFARCLARPADGFALLAGPFLRRLFIGPPALHLAKQTFALELLLQDLEGLLDVVVSDEYLQGVLLCSQCFSVSNGRLRTTPLAF